MSNPLATWPQQLLRHLPNFCQLCALPSKAPVCPDCQRDLPRAPPQRCLRCASALTRKDAPCAICLQRKFYFEQSHAPFVYQFPADILIQNLKYKKQTGLASWLAEQIYNHLLQINADIHADIILPMPMHPARLRQRGLNHAVLIARTLSRLLNTTLSINNLQRMRDTQPQVALSGKARWRNVQNAFTCQQRLDGKTVLVVDDVMSTGASLNAVAKTLKAQGAQKVINLLATRALSKPLQNKE